MYRVLCMYHKDKKANSLPLINISFVFGTLPIIYSNTLLVHPFGFSCGDKISFIESIYYIFTHDNIIYNYLYTFLGTTYKCILNNQINCLSHFCIYFVLRAATNKPLERLIFLFCFRQHRN